MITRSNYEIWMLDYADGKLNAAQQKLFLAFLEQNPDLKKELEAFEQLALNQNSDPEKISGSVLHKKQSWLLEKYSVDELVFHYNEGNLNPEELREWNDLVKTMPALPEQAKKEKQLILKPAAGETFAAKDLLKRGEVVYELTLQNYTTCFIQYHESKELALHMAIQAFLTQHPALKTEFRQYGQLMLRPDVSVAFAEKASLKKKEKVVGLHWWKYAAAVAVVVLGIWVFYPADKNTGVLQASNGQDSLSGPNSPVPNNNAVSPQNVIALDQNNNHQQQQNKVQHSQGLARQDRQPKEKPAQRKNEELPLQENPVSEHQFVKQDQPNHQEKDSLVTPVNKVEPQEQPVARNNTGQKNNNGSAGMLTVDTPRELVSAVVNKKYYEQETPRQQVSSSFYAMRNVVHSVSGGEADIQKKEDEEYKEFSLKIGNFGFSRKKHKRE